MQTDLFEIPVDTTATQVGNKFAFLERYRFSIRLDQVLAAAILMIMVYVFVFSFGVENGKRFAMAELRAERSKREHMVEELRDKLIESKVFPVQQEEAQTTIKKQAIVEPKAAIVVANASSVKTGSKSPPVVTVTSVPVTPSITKKGYPQGKYTIQIVTYKSQTIADHAIGELLKKGIQGFVIPKGSNLQVCVNAFEKENQAKQALGELKSQGIIPADAFIRTIPQ